MAILDFEITYYLDLSFNFYTMFCDAIAINMVIYSKANTYTSESVLMVHDKIKLFLNNKFPDALKPKMT